MRKYLLQIHVQGNRKHVLARLRKKGVIFSFRWYELFQNEVQWCLQNSGNTFPPGKSKTGHTHVDHGIGIEKGLVLVLWSPSPHCMKFVCYETLIHTYMSLHVYNSTHTVKSFSVYKSVDPSGQRLSVKNDLEGSGLWKSEVSLSTFQKTPQIL